MSLGPKSCYACDRPSGASCLACPSGDLIVDLKRAQEANDAQLESDLRRLKEHIVRRERMIDAEKNGPEEKRLYAEALWCQREIVNVSLVEVCPKEGEKSYRIMASVSLDGPVGSLKDALIDILNNCVKR